MATTITLKRPVEHAGQIYSSIVVDEPTIGGLEVLEEAKAAGRSETSAMIEMLAVDCEWPIEAIRKIRALDMNQISAAFAPFAQALETSDGMTE